MQFVWQVIKCSLTSTSVGSNNTFYPLPMEFEGGKGKPMSSISHISCKNCFSGSSIKFQGHTSKKIDNFCPNWAFRYCNFSFNSQMATKWCTKPEAAKTRCLILFQGHSSISRSQRQKIDDFDPNWVFPDCNSSSNSQMVIKWCTKLEGA